MPSCSRDILPLSSVVYPIYGYSGAVLTIENPFQRKMSGEKLN
jgi:hypothetical protein